MNLSHKCNYDCVHVFSYSSCPNNYVAHIKAALVTSFIQVNLFSSSYFGGSLFSTGLGGNAPPVELDAGYYILLQLKFIWISRFFLQDQFLFVATEKRIHADIDGRLRRQFDAMQFPQEHFEVSIPTYDWRTMSLEGFLNEHVRKGRPAVIKNFNISGAAEWTPEFLSANYGDYVVSAVNMSTESSMAVTLAQLYQLARGGDPLFARGASGVFDIFPVRSSLTDC